MSNKPKCEMRKIEPSATLLLNEQSRHLEANGQTIYKFGFGQSPFLPPDFVQEALMQNVHRKEYSPVQGLLPLREAIASFHTAWQDIPISPDQIMVAPGSKSLLFTILAAFENANVMIPAPAWVSYSPQAQMLKHCVTRLETDFTHRWRIFSDQLEALCQKDRENILILNAPGNPDGLMYAKSELEALADVARKHNIWVISDEIYALLAYEGVYHSLVNFYPERTFITTGLSKWCGAGGWRLGAAILPLDFPDAMKQLMLGIASETYSCAPTPIQYASIAAYKNLNRMLPYLEMQRHILKTIGDFCAEKLQKAGVNVHSCEGGFYLFPDFMPFQERLAAKGIHDSETLCRVLLEDTGVALLPATAFGFAPSYLAARLAFVDFDDPKLVEKTAFDLEKHAPKMKIGIEKLTQWLSF